jgi:leucine dehydrogenase
MARNVLNQMEEFDHEQVVFFQDKATGLKAIVAIHNTTLGPALGGTRMWPYATEEDALKDALRLSRGMTYKAAVSGLNLGGGKAVIIGDPKTMKSQSLFRVYGRFLNTLNGRYITAEDVGIDVNDIEYMYMETDYVVGIESSHGGSGDPAPFTALGVYQGMLACLKTKMGHESLKGIRVNLQGVGAVGHHLLETLVQEGADVTIADIDKEKVEKLAKQHGVKTADPKEIVTMPCDIFAPCALGAVINSQTIDKLQCAIVAGSANNQLEQDDQAEMLRKKGILYAPDYVINAGGLINVYHELEGYSRERAERMTRGIYYNLMRVFEISERKGISTRLAADHLVERRLDKISRANNIYSNNQKDLLSFIHERRGKAV